MADKIYELPLHTKYGKMLSLPINMIVADLILVLTPILCFPPRYTLIPIQI